MTVFTEEEVKGIDLSELREKYLEMKKGVLPYTSKENFLKMLREDKARREAMVKSSPMNDPKSSPMSISKCSPLDVEDLLT